jgi:hypothetical protein
LRRIAVELILSLFAQGVAPEALLEDYPDLEPDDRRACLAYARAVIARDTLDAVLVNAPGSFSSIDVPPGWRHGCAATGTRVWSAASWGQTPAERAICLV